MLVFLFRKLLNNKWLMLCLLVGNIMLVGVVVCVPMYTNAITKRVFVKDMEQSQFDNARYPFIIEIEQTLLNKGSTVASAKYADLKENIVPRLIDTYNLPVLARIEKIIVSNCQAKLADSRNGVTASTMVELISYANIDNHVRLLSGRLPSSTMEDGIVECMITETTHLEKNLLIGDVIELLNTYTWESPFMVKVVGIFTNANESDYYWTSDPNAFNDKLFIQEPLLRGLFIESSELQSFAMTASEQILFDYHKVDVLKLEGIQAAEKRLFEEFDSDPIFRSGLSSITETYITKASKLVITMYVLQIPIFVLLGFFIFMVSKKILQLERNEISVMQSRGAKSGQIVGVYFVQGLIISIFAIIAGIWLGYLICKIIGSANGFLELVQRSSLEVTITLEVYAYAGIAAALSMLTMVLPVFKFSKVTIVSHKTASLKKSKPPVWQRFYLDFVLFAVSLYALYNYNTQYAALSERVIAVQSVDPLLFVSTSFFIAGTGLIFIRLFPYIIKLLFMAFKSLWPPSLYASLLSITRSGGEEQFIMIFLVFTLAAGIFDANAARSLNQNSEDRTRYLSGTDFVVKEKWFDNTRIDEEGNVIIPEQLIYREPDYHKYANIEDIDIATKVTRRQLAVDFGDVSDSVEFMAIEPSKFSKIVWFREGLLPVHINNYLNVLAANQDAVLVSSVLRENYGLKIGQVLTLNDEGGGKFNVTIKGFFDYWPGFKVREAVYDTQAEPYIAEQSLIVGNNSYYQSLFGVRPYEVWIKTVEGTSGSGIYEYAEENDLLFETFIDTRAELVNSKNDAILQGINGVLTIGFIVTLLICFIGFLIFWILSIKARKLQFGIFRAMGMSTANIYSLLISEQVLISGAAIGIGTIIGEIASRLYVPLIQVSFTASERQIPLNIITQRQDYYNLFTSVGLIIVLCLCILGFIVSKLRIAEALKLGED